MIGDQPFPAFACSVPVGEKWLPGSPDSYRVCRQEQFPAAKLRWGYFFQIDTKGQGSLTKEIVKWQRDQELQALDRNLEGLRVGEYTHTGMGVFWVCV